MSDDADKKHDARDPDDLEAEREFLLRSLDDLDSELLAGNIDPDTYRVLHDDYTARASAVIRSIADGADRTSAEGPRVPRTMRALTFSGIVVFAILAAVLLAHAIGQRGAGQTITGNAQAGGTTTTVSQAAVSAAAKAAAAATPNDYSARINYARRLMAAGDYPDAVKEFVASAKIDKTQPEPLAYTGWLTALVARQVTDKPTQKQLLDAAEESIDKAIAVGPQYSPSYVFKGLILAQIENKPCPGAVAFDQYLANAPADDPMRQQVLSALADAVKAGKCPSPSSTPTSKP